MNPASFLPTWLTSVQGFNTALTGLGVPSFVTSGIATVAGGLMSYAATIGAILTFIGLARIGPDISVNISGAPVLKQLKGLDVLKNIVGTAKEIVGGIEKAAKGVAAKLGVIQQAANTLNSINIPTGFGDNDLNMANNPTRINPYATQLLNLLTISSAASTTSTNIVTTNTGGQSVLDDVKIAWEPVRLKLDNSGTYFVSIAYAKALTDIYCELAPDSGIMSLSRAIEITTDTDDDLSILFGFTATVQTFVGTLFSTATINSATVAITNLADLSTSTTTIVTTITSLEAEADLYTQALLDQMAKDVENQAKYKSQANNLSSIAQSAAALAAVQKSHSKEIQALFLATINPAYLNAITDMKDLINLSSTNTATQAEALANIIEAGTTST